MIEFGKSQIEAAKRIKEMQERDKKEPKKRPK